MFFYCNNLVLKLLHEDIYCYLHVFFITGYKKNVPLVFVLSIYRHFCSAFTGFFYYTLICVLNFTFRYASSYAVLFLILNDFILDSSSNEQNQIKPRRFGTIDKHWPGSIYRLQKYPQRLEQGFLTQVWSNARVCWVGLRGSA